MNLLGFLHLILLYAWPNPIFLKKKKHDSTSEWSFSALRRNFQFYKFLIIKRQAKKPLRIIPELKTYNSNVALWHSLRTRWTHHSYHFYRCSYVFKIPGKYQWRLMVSFDRVRQQETWEHHACCRQRKMETFQFSCRISWARRLAIRRRSNSILWCIFPEAPRNTVVMADSIVK